jgi:hypothetical protein
MSDTIDIHEAVMDHLQEILEDALINNIGEDDEARAGIVIQGKLQGEPVDPDDARITVEIFENDPSGQFLWFDRVVMVETNGVVTMGRRFLIRIWALLEETQENLAAARKIASTLKARLEKAILSELWTGVQSTEGEYIARGALARSMRTYVKQGGGPESYDFRIYSAFEIWTTKGVL